MAPQDIFDLIFAISLVLFALRGVKNGLVVEVAGIFSLVAGFWAARSWHGALAPRLTFISDPSWQSMAACVLLFIGAMLAVALAARLLKKIIAFSFAGWLDKILGALFAVAKAILVWALIFIVLEKLFRDAPFLRDSRALPYFQAIVAQIREWLPPDLASRLS